MNLPLLETHDACSMLAMPMHRSQTLSVESMQQRLREVCGHFNLRAQDGHSTLRGGVELVRLGTLEAAVVDQSEVRVDRAASDIRRDNAENFFLIFQARGRARMGHGGEMVTLAAGDAVLIDSAQPSLFAYEFGHSQQISLHIPRREMQQRFGAGVRPGLHLAAQDPLCIAMRAMLLRMFQLAGGGASHLGEAFLSVLGSLLLERRDEAGAAPVGRGEKVLAEALALIGRRLRDPAFGAAALAQQLGVSARVLQRAFAPLGESPSRRILHARLAACHAALAADGDRYVSAIAYDHGFNDLSFFYREFRKRYGQAPGRLARRSDA